MGIHIIASAKIFNSYLAHKSHHLLLAARNFRLCAAGPHFHTADSSRHWIRKSLFVDSHTLMQKAAISFQTKIMCFRSAYVLRAVARRSLSQASIVSASGRDEEDAASIAGANVHDC